MPNRPIRSVRTAAAVLGVLAVSLPAQGESPADGPRVAVTEHLVDGSPRPRLVVSASRDGPTATATGLRIGPAGRARLLPFATANREVDGWSLRCASDPIHQAWCDVRLVDGAVELRVADRLPLRTEIDAIGIAWQVDLGGPADALDGPGAPGADGGRAALDAMFRAPLALAARGRRAVGIAPDLAVAERLRRLPQRLAVTPTDTGAELYHGLAKDVDGADRLRLRGETLQFVHRLRLSASTDIDAARRRWCAAHWRSGPAADGSSPLGDRSLDAWLLGRITALGSGTTRDFVVGDLTAAVAPESSAAGELLRFGIGGTLLATAAALPIDDPRVGEILAIARAAPAREGFVPNAWVFAATTAEGRWSDGDPTGPEPELFRTADSAEYGLRVLDLADRLGEGDELLRRVDDLAAFLTARQASDGSFRTRYDPSYLLPARRPLREGADQLRIAAFLAAHARATGRVASLDAAARALEYVLRRLPPADRWRPAFASSGTVATAALVDATQVAVALLEHAPRFASIAREMIAELATRQIAWNPPQWPDPQRGGFPAFDRDPARGAPVTAAAGLALVEAHVALGAADALDRAIAALRQALVTTDDPRAVRAVQRARALLGAGVIDLRDPSGPIHAGFDSLWFEDVEVTSRELSFRVATRADFTRPREITIHGLDPAAPLRLTADGADLRGEPRGDRHVVEVVPRAIPVVRFDPPSRLAAGEPWLPEVTVHGPADTTRYALEVATVGSAEDLATVPLERRADRLVARGPVALPDIEGVRIKARVVIERAGSRYTAPAVGWREIEIAAFTAVDCPFPAAADAGLPAPVRFVDGRSLAQPLIAGLPLALDLPVPPSAERVELVITGRGGVEVRAGGRPIDSFADREPDLASRMLTVLADPRLWADGRLALELAPASGQSRAEVVRVEYRGIGDRARIPGARAAAAVPTHAEIRVLVVPVDSTASDATTIAEHLRLAFFGADDYRATPPPAVRPTTGSAARLIEKFSGGRTRLTGTVTTGVRAPDADPCLTSAESLATTLEAAAPALGPHLRGGRPDVIVVIVDAPPFEGPRPSLAAEWRHGDGRAIPVVRMAARMADGTSLASGRIVSMLGRFVLGWTGPDIRAGELGLDGSTADPHVPPWPTAPRLVAAGWSGVVDPEPTGEVRSILLDPMRTGRTAVRLRGPTGFGRGDLWLTAEAGPANRWDGWDGLLIVRRDLGPHLPRFVRGDGSVHRVEGFRISAATSITDTAVVPAGRRDLLRRADALAESTRPSLVTLEGELPWRIDGLRSDGRGGVRMQVRWLGRDLLRDPPIEWSQASASDPPTVRREPRGDVFGMPSGTSLRASIELPRDPAPQRVFARLELAPGSGAVAFRAAADGTPIGAGAIRPSSLGGPIPIELDLPPGSRSLTLTWTATDAPFAATLTALFAVPRAGGAVVLDELAAGSVRLADGTFVGRARRLTADRRPVDVLVQLPPGRHLLALRYGIAGGDAAATLTLRLREPDGSKPVTLIEALPIEDPDAVGRMVFELPDRASERAAILELSAAGGGAVWILGARLRAN